MTNKRRSARASRSEASRSEESSSMPCQHRACMPRQWQDQLQGGVPKAVSTVRSSCAAADWWGGAILSGHFDDCTNHVSAEVDDPSVGPGPASSRPCPISARLLSDSSRCLCSPSSHSPLLIRDEATVLIHGSIVCLQLPVYSTNNVSQGRMHVAAQPPTSDLADDERAIPRLRRRQRIANPPGRADSLLLGHA